MSHLLVALAGAALLLVSRASPAAPDAGADGWVTHPDAGRNTPVVLRFRRVLELERVPAAMRVTVTADNRFVLFVNGARIASGPSTGTLARWRYSTVDLAPHLRRGSNVIAATVWNFGEAAPMAQVSLATGFRLTGEGISTGEPGWRVAIDPGHSALKGNSQIDWQYYVASAPEVIDGSQSLVWAEAENRLIVPARRSKVTTLSSIDPIEIAPLEIEPLSAARSSSS